MNHDATHCTDYSKSRCPKSCYRAQLTQDLIDNWSRLRFLPVSWFTEISAPHGRLIDADNLKCPLSWQGEIVKATVREAPTIIEAEVSDNA